MVSKLALGTAQFGLKYGINNKTGILSDEDIFKLLQYAHQNEIDTLDTAFNYGNSENRIGEILRKNEFSFNIISKAPSGSNKDTIIRYFNTSLIRLNTNCIYGYLLHDFNDYLKDNKILNPLYSLIEKQAIKKIGFSIYYPEQLERLLNDKVKFDIIQFPYNLVDTRFEKYFEILYERRVEIHIRSVFLQGLFFMECKNLPQKLIPFKDLLLKINALKIKINRSIENILLNFAVQNTYVSKVIIGIDTFEQLKKNIDELNYPLKENEIYLIKRELSEIDIPSELLIPSNWG